ncbi:MAG: queA1, partial [Myxococcales bacterium]|nr:queA1 [Myxococcales bacterium]
MSVFVKQIATDLRTADFHYDLPPERIASAPTASRDESRLLVMRRTGESPNDHAHFRDVGAYLPPRSLLVVNDTRVIAARLRGRKSTGGGFELLLTRKISGHPAPSAETDFEETWEALGRSLGNVALESILEVGALRATLVERGADGRVTVRLTGRGAPTLVGLLEAVGEVPLPPYIETARREAGAAAPVVDDRARYQTVYADAPGAVAAPTAGLHFTPTLLDELRAAGHELARVTLHVGPGTFRPVKTPDARAHEMDEERYAIPEATAAAIARARAEGRPVIAVGTTVVRTL